MHVLISADARYLRTHAAVSVVSALEHGHEVTLQCLVSDGWEAQAGPYRRLDGVSIEQAVPPAHTAAGYTMPRLALLPRLVERHHAVALLDADTLVRAPLTAPEDISVCVWPWGPTVEQRRERARHDGTTFEWCTEWMRFTIAGGLYLAGDDGLRFARAIAREAQKLIAAGELWWGCDQVAIWRAFVREFPPAHFRARQQFGFAHGLNVGEDLVHPFPHERDEAPWRDTVELHRGRLLVRAA